MSNLPVPVPATWSVNLPPTAGQINAMRDALNFLLNPPMAVLYQGAVQSIPNNAFTALTWDQSLVDSYGGHSSVTNPSRYTAQVPGWYDLDGGFSFAANVTGVRDGAWYKNGAQITTPGAGAVTGSPGAGSSPTQAMPGLQVFLNAGDYVELWVIQTSGGALNTNIATFASFASIRFVHS